MLQFLFITFALWQEAASLRSEEEDTLAAAEPFDSEAETNAGADTSNIDRYSVADNSSATAEDVRDQPLEKEEVDEDRIYKKQTFKDLMDGSNSDDAAKAWRPVEAQSTESTGELNFELLNEIGVTAKPSKLRQLALMLHVDPTNVENKAINFILVLSLVLLLLAVALVFRVSAPAQKTTPQQDWASYTKKIPKRENDALLFVTEQPKPKKIETQGLASCAWRTK